MKSASLIPRVEATRPPTFTCALSPNRMPLGLTRKTWPLEVRLPKIAEASGPSTRLRATEFLPGWTKTTLSPWPMEKVCQLMATRGVVWLTVRVLPADWTVADPEETDPPVGRVWA